MRSNTSFMVASLIASSALCHTTASLAADTAPLPVGERLLMVVTIAAVFLLLLGFMLYLEVASLRPLVLRTGVEAKAREEREENARQEVAKASADLYVALTELQAQIPIVRIARSPAEVADASVPANPVASIVAAASEPPRDTLAAPPPCPTSAPPGEATNEAEVGDDDPTRVLSREAMQQALAGKPLRSNAARHPSPSEKPAPFTTGRQVMRPPALPLAQSEAPRKAPD